MIKIFGPTYRYRNEILSQPQIILVEDHHFDEQDQCFHVQKLLANSECDPKSHVLIVGGLGHDDVLTEYSCISMPFFAAAACAQFNNENILPDWSAKTAGFNFMINKPRIHRRFMLMLIQHFGLENFCYSLPWRNKGLICSDMLRLSRNGPYELIVDTNPQTMLASTNLAFGDEVIDDQGLRNGQHKNSHVYNKLLKSQVVEPSCVSLITGSLFYEHETRVSETTVMAFYGGTIPIWVGGWRCAQRLSELGFDVFDDLVDHSYQDLPDPMDRVYQAINLNLHLLRDFDRVREFVCDNQHRLKKNLELCQQNVFLDRVNQQISAFRPDVGQEVLAWAQEYMQGFC